MRYLLMLAWCCASAAFADEPREAVIVAAVDIPAGTKVTLEMLSQRPVPKRLLTSSVIKPDSASYVVQQTTRRAMLAGDLLLWSSFEPADPRVVQGCEQKFAEKPVAADQVRRARAAVEKARAPR